MNSRILSEKFKYNEHSIRRKDMRLDEAIQILHKYEMLEYDGEGKDLDEAVQLGIEALKAIRNKRQDPWNGPILSLPGETEE
jgi:hypothetical protein